MELGLIILLAELIFSLPHLKTISCQLHSPSLRRNLPTRTDLTTCQMKEKTEALMHMRLTLDLSLQRGKKLLESHSITRQAHQPSEWRRKTGK